MHNVLPIFTVTESLNSIPFERNFLTVKYFVLLRKLQNEFPLQKRFVVYWLINLMTFAYLFLKNKGKLFRMLPQAKINMAGKSYNS